MSEVHVNQIKSYLSREYTKLLDLSDAKNDNEKENFFYTRALAASIVRYYCLKEKQDVVQYITDGYKDNGIDAVCYNDQEGTIYFVQSKWHANGKGSISRGDVQKFIKGVQDICNFRFNRFNQKVQKLNSYISDSINKPGTKIFLIISYTGTQLLGDEQKRDIDDFINELNNPDQLASYRVLTQSEVYKNLIVGNSSKPIDERLMISNWGLITEPYKCYYGTISATDIGNLYDKYNPLIFSENIRSFLGLSDANKDINETLENCPENFFYFNNGITILCNSVEKSVQGGNTRDSGIFDCKNIYVVNGAQTVGAIGMKYQNSQEKVNEARLLVRIVSLENTPDQFAKKLTKATNTQNRIESRDFITQDRQHERLKDELLLSQVNYSYKRGDLAGEKEDSFNFEEAILSLACAKGKVSFAVLAKREVSKLWEDLTKPPYTELINESLSGLDLWHLVQIQREIDKQISLKIKLNEGKKKAILIHGNRFITHLIHIEINKTNPTEDMSSEKLSKYIALNIQLYAERIYEILEKNYPDAMVAYFFKNQTKCEDLLKKLKDN